MLKIFYGRNNIDMEGFVCEGLRESLAACGKVILLVPEQFTLEAERAVLERLELRGMMDIEVLSVSRLTSRVFAETGGGRRTPVDKYGRHMLMSRIIDKKKDELRLYKGMETQSSFVALADDVIYEMKQYGKSPEDLAQIIAETPADSILRRKLSDIRVLYEAYEEYMQGRFLDGEDVATLLISRLSESALVTGSAFWVWGFDYFTPKNIELLGQLMSYSKGVNVVLTGDEPGGSDSELFEITRLMARKLLQKAEELGVEASATALLGEQIDLHMALRRGCASQGRQDGAAKNGQQAANAACQRKLSPGIAALEKALYALPFVPYSHIDYKAEPTYKGNNAEICEERELAEKNGAIDRTGSYKNTSAADQLKSNNTGAAPDIKLVRASNVYAEAETAAAFVTELVREQGYRLRDIVIICNDMEGRASIISRVFAEYGIELFMDKKRGVLQNPIVAYILYLLDAVQKGMRTSDVIGMLKTGMTELNADEIEELENYAIKYKIKGRKWKKPFEKGEFEYGEEGLGRIEASRQKVAELTDGFEKSFKKVKTAAGKAGELYAFLKEASGVCVRIEELLESERAEAHFEEADETAQIWDVTINLLNQINSLLGEEEITGESFATILRSGFEAVEVGVLPPTADGLMMGTMQRTRTGHIKALIVLGANEGVLPSGGFGESLLNDDEKQRLYQRNIEVSKRDELKAMEERLGIYKNLTKPEKMLYMSYSLTDPEGNKQRPSAIFNKLTRIFPGNPVGIDILEQAAASSKPGLTLVQNKKSGLRHLTRALRDAADGGSLENTWQAAARWYNENDPQDMNLVKEGLLFENRAEQLEKELVNGLYRYRDGDLVVSPSAIEKYSRCSFAHFLSYGLAPEERRAFEVSAREIGDIYHQCLMEVSERLTSPGVAVTAENSPWMTVSEESLSQMVSEFVDREASGYRGGLFQNGAEEEYRKERIKRVCAETAWVLISQVRKGEIASVDFEAGFGRSREKAFAPIEVKIGGETAYIEGKIDRVDRLRGDRVKIIDYKTGNEKFDLSEVLSGYRLQLMLYLKAAQEEKREPAGVFYFKVDESMPAAGEVKDFRLDGVMVNKPEIIEGIAGAFESRSDVVPIYRKSDGSVCGTSENKLLSEEEFSELQMAVDRKLSELYGALAGGLVAARPKKGKGDVTACRYCAYKSICQFDKSLPGCRFWE